MEVDLVVMGAGSGGYEAGIYAYRRKMRTVLVELSPESVGGNCLNRGCIPSKYMRHGAHLLDQMEIAQRWGIKPTGHEIDYASLKEGRDDVVVTIRENFKKFANQINLPIVYGRGVIKDPNTVFVEGAEETIKTKFILIATGSRPVAVGDLVPDGKYVVDTDQIWELDSLPKRVVIVGGGAVGVEFAYIFKKYGAEVVLLELQRSLLPSDDIPEDSGRYLGRKLKQLGVDVRTKTTIESWEKTPDGVKTKLTDGSEVSADFILLAVGRKPNTEGLGLEEVGVEKDSKGFVKVNEFSQTSVPNIYACGDITSPLMLAHKAMYEGKIAVNHILGGTDWKRDDRVVPKIIYSAFEVASVGLTEDQAEEEDYEVKVGVTSFVSNPKAMDDGENEGFVRIVADEDTGEILGCHIVGPNAGELIHQVVHMIRDSKDVEFASKTMYSHPSLSEAIGQSASEIYYGPITWVKR
ncbi:dihydrolipoyl dehydrogenase [Hydrogenivirga sp. 128-5-R1-1]|uniref:dihydrolipoyl dehydrogenase n=1 Tax=Hydrogenivirga sp. 128-5-R1-1 TaxID=392423 RepID=UPI00015EF84D|nr:dihydrolipoyl dehydrogenase [Hydrogenivirga sp. 128-5-R1-1]EDP75684.1 dihydrolipoamide dehydrogenase [Hydrogenivirga sp. 128-5-R1-1]